MSFNTLSDEEIILYIQAGGKQQEVCIEQIYQQFFGFVHSAGVKHRLTPGELKDVYTDAILIFRDHVVNGTFRRDSKCSSYVYRIFSNKCVDYVRKKAVRKLVLEEEFPAHIQDNAPDILAMLTVREDVDSLLANISQLGETCRNVLMDWAYWGYSMSEIAKRQNLKDAKVAASKKYNCLEQLKRLMKPPNIRP